MNETSREVGIVTRFRSPYLNGHHMHLCLAPGQAHTAVLAGAHVQFHFASFVGSPAIPGTTVDRTELSGLLPELLPKDLPLPFVPLPLQRLDRRHRDVWMGAKSCAIQSLLCIDYLLLLELVGNSLKGYVH